MTRRDQTLRAWIERPSQRHNFISCVSHRGTTHRKSTHTRHRRAAREFNHLHTIAILIPATTTPTSTPHHQLPLIP